MCPDEKKFKVGYKSPRVDLSAQKVVNQTQMLLPLQRVTLSPNIFRTLVSGDFIGNK